MPALSKSMIILGLSLLILLIYACPKPEDEDPNPYAQVNIDWPSLADTPWPMIGHDPQGTNRTNITGVKTVAGFDFISHDYYFQSPIVLDDEGGVLRIASEGDSCKLVRFGEANWSLAIDKDLSSISAVTVGANDVTYIPGGEAVWAISTSTHEVLWHHPVKRFASNLTPGLHDDLYFFAGDRDSLDLISLQIDGAERWQLPMPNVSFLPSTLVLSPDGERIYLSEDDGISAISRDGISLWKYLLEDRVFHVLVDNAGNIYGYPLDNGSIVSLSANGDLRWELFLGDIGLTKVESTISPTMDFNGNVYFSAIDTSQSRGVVSIDNTGAFRWFARIPTATDLIVDGNNFIYFSGYSEENYVLHIGALSSAGTTVWQLEVEGTSDLVIASPVINSNGEIYYPLKGLNNQVLWVY